WRAVCDHLAHEFSPAVERLARQHRSELVQHEVRLGMADAAALLVKPPSEPLLVGLLIRITALRAYGWGGNSAKEENGGGARHPWHSPKFIFLAKHRPALAETEGRGQTWPLTCQSLRGHSRWYGLGSPDFANQSSMSERRTRPESAMPSIASAR